MLNRVKKIFILLMLCANFTGFALASQSTVSYVNINDMAYQDVEIVITDDSKVLVPFKQLADIFEIKYSANRADKMISFKTFDGKDGVINLRGVFVEDYTISDKMPIFLSQGIMEGVFNEAYLPAEAVEKIMGIKLEADYESLSLTAQVSRDIPLLKNNNLLLAEDSGPHAYKDVVAPKKPGKITLNSIGLNVNMTNDYMKNSWQNHSDSNDTFHGSTQASVLGNIYGGKYRVEATEYNYHNDAFVFGGATATYANKLKYKDGKTYYYELGKVTGRTDEDASIGTNIFGAQYWNYNYDKEKPETIHGYVKPTSTVRLTANNQEPIILSTYSGYYTLKDVKLPNPVTSIKLEEINEDGTAEVIREEVYNVYGNRPFENEERYSAYAGVWGYNNRFFREGANIYRGNNKKVTGGGYYQKGVKDNITFESKASIDKIYEKSASSTIYTIPTNDTLLVMGTQKSPNYLEGATSLNSIEWQGNDKNIKARATGGVSIAHDVRENNTKLGYSGKIAGEYEKDLTPYGWKFIKPKMLRGRIEGFHNSQDYYIASSDSTAKNDRTGGKVSTGFSFNSTNIGSSYSRYYSNLGHKYEGGNIVFNEATSNFSTKIPKVASLRFSGNYKQGENNLGKNKNYFYDANASRHFGKWAFVQMGRMESFYDTHFHQETSLNKNYLSKYYDNYAQIDLPIPGGNFGRFSLGHSFVRYKNANYDNGYNVFKFGYTFPTWKNWTLGLNWGLKYYGQPGNDLGATISHRARSGQTMTVGYQYSHNTGYFIDNMFTPTTNRHTVIVTFNDAFQLFNHGLKSVGIEDLNKGIFEALAFIDVNKNGKFDKKVDIPMKNIPVITSWSGGEFMTNKRGRVCSTSIEQGVYNVALNMETLPITVAPVSNDLISRKVRIDGGQTTKLEIPLSSTVGSVSGVLNIFDDFDRGLKITDFIIVVLNEDGQEVSYSTVDETGQFYISGLAPGKYKLQLDEKFIGAYGLEEVPEMSYREIFIPYDYNNPTDIIEQNLEYKTLAL